MYFLNAALSQSLLGQNSPKPPNSQTSVGHSITATVQNEKDAQVALAVSLAPTEQRRAVQAQVPSRRVLLRRYGNLVDNIEAASISADTMPGTETTGRSAAET